MLDYFPLRGLAASSPTVHLRSSSVVELLGELDRLRASGAGVGRPAGRASAGGTDRASRRQAGGTGAQEPGAP